MDEQQEKRRQHFREYVCADAAWRTDIILGSAVPPKLSSWSEMDSLRFPEDRWLVSGLLPREGMSTIAAVSGEGKSLIAMYLAKCLVEGAPLFDNPDLKTRKSRVLYVNLEMSQSEMQRRGRKIGLDVANENLLILNEDNFNLNLPKEKDFSYGWLINCLYEQQVDVLIIDTFRAAAGGLREDKAEEIRTFFQKFQIVKSAGVSVIFLEHLRKPSQFEGKVPKKEQVLGSQDKTANLEVLLMVRKDEASGLHHIYQRKNRIGEEMRPFAIKIADKVDGSAERLVFEYAGEIEDDVNKKAEAKTLIVDILSSGEMKTTKELMELVKKQVGQKNLRAALRELTASGTIDFTRDGKQNAYFIKQVDELPLESEV